MQSEETYEALAEDKPPYQYFMRIDPDMKDILGPIELINDDYLGREMRVRTARVGMIRGATQLKEVTVWLDPLPHIRQEKMKDLQGWYSSKLEGLGNSAQRSRPCETDAILTQPYGGYCPVGCTFCYINSGARGYRGSGLITVPMDYAAQVRRQLRGMQVSAAGYFSSFTDPFLPLEEYYHNAQDGATAFTEAGLPVFFLSRLHYPGWAIDLLRQNPYSYAQKSINTSDPEIWKKISPGAISLEDHFYECRKLHEAGVYISIQINPIIPGIVDHDDIFRLFEHLAESGVDHVIVKFVEAGHAWAKAMVDRIKRKFPGERGDTFESLFTENQCGGQRTIQEEYRRKAHELYQRHATQLGMTYSLCYEYTQNKDTGQWSSMGPEFLTADQCHGHRVPIHVKRGLNFVPLDVCPPSGCLHCADQHTKYMAQNDGAAPCGSKVMPLARALTLADLRKGL